MIDGLEALRHAVRGFAQERDWEQFHTPRNLAMALGGEAGELLSELQWLTDDQVGQGLAQGELRLRMADEMADILIYLVRMAEVCDIDLLDAAEAKLQRNESRYRVDVVKGSADRSLRDQPHP